MRTKEEIYKDLRIGNIFQFPVNGRTAYWRISDILTNNFEVYFKENPNYDHSTNLTPVEIHSLILIDCGFKCDGAVCRIDIPNGQIVFHGNDCLIKYGKNGSSLPRIKYLHQLQNLYYSLTGDELNVTL